MPQQAQRAKRATIREVAAATGLSAAAVSYALRGVQTSGETQERVRRAAAELGYNPDRIARALAGGRTGTVGVLFGSLEDWWQQLLGVGIGGHCWRVTGTGCWWIRRVIRSGRCCWLVSCGISGWTG